MNRHVALCCMRAASAHAVQRLFGKPPAVVAAPADQSTLETCWWQCSKDIPCISAVSRAQVSDHAFVMLWLMPSQMVPGPTRDDQSNSTSDADVEATFEQLGKQYTVGGS